MSRTMQKVRQGTETITETQSVTLIRNILRSSLSSIAYLRYIFPEDNFVDTQLAGLKIKSLVGKDNKEIEALNHWLEEGIFDALDKHYLRALVFSVFARFNDPSSLLESYTFKFAYPSDGNVSLNFTAKAGDEKQKLSFMSKEQIQQAWCTMIRTLITLSHTLPPLPNDRHIAMRLYYYDDITPSDYNPPGFSPADDAPDFAFIEENERIEIGGGVKTSYHTVSMRLDTAMPHFASKSQTKEQIDEMSSDVVRGIVYAFEEGSICTKELADSLGIARNDQRAIDAIDKLLEMHIIKNENGVLCPNKTPENIILFDEAKKVVDSL